VEHGNLSERGKIDIEEGRKVLASRLSDRQTDRVELALESIGGSFSKPELARMLPGCNSHCRA
jgi:hypothetical protein